MKASRCCPRIRRDAEKDKAQAQCHLVLATQKHFRGLMFFLSELLFILQKLRNGQTRRRHECRRGTHECVRHIRFHSLQNARKENYDPWPLSCSRMPGGLRKMTNIEKKCAHPACSCPVPDGENYCSTSCEDAAGLIELSCNCEHASCETLTSPAE